MNKIKGVELVTARQVDLAVHSWSIRFPEAKYGPESLRMIADEYLEDLQAEQVTSRQFVDAALVVRRRCKWFPKMSEIMDVVREIRARPIATVQADYLQLTDTTGATDYGLTPEEIQRNLERVDTIKRMMAGELSMDQAQARIEKLNDIKIFNGGQDGKSQDAQSRI